MTKLIKPIVASVDKSCISEGGVFGSVLEQRKRDTSLNTEGGRLIPPHGHEQAFLEPGPEILDSTDFGYLTDCGYCISRSCVKWETDFRGQHGQEWMILEPVLKTSGRERFWIRHV